MTTNDHELVHKELAYKIIGAALDVHRDLGPGFLEKVYRNALVVALRERGLQCQPQFQINVYYHGVLVGEYFADILVEGKVILELKVADAIGDAHKAQALNYLKATHLRLAIILNFSNSTLERVRVVL